MSKDLPAPAAVSIPTCAIRSESSPRRSSLPARLLLLLVIFAGTHVLALDNPSFELPGGLGAWKPAGKMQDGKAQAKIVQDTHHEGQRSLLLAAQEGGEAVVEQKISLPSGSRWRLHCWVKVDGRDATAPREAGRPRALPQAIDGETADEESLSQDSASDPADDSSGAAVQIRLTDDTILAGAPRSPGAADWRRLELDFRMPSEGVVRLALSVAAPGKRPVQAWFDDLHLDRLEDAKVEQKFLPFPILWAQGRPYDKLLPKNAAGANGVWSCGQVARAQIVRYWSMKTKLRCSGTYWYYRRDNRERMYADYSIPFQWDRMVPTLRSLLYTDPRVDPIADFAYRFTVAQRTQWPVKPDSPWYYTRNEKDVEVKYFGFDAASWQSFRIGEYLRAHSWNDLYAVLRKEIDEERPVLMHISSSTGDGHFVVITGYRKIADRFEFAINWGLVRPPPPSQTYRLDGTIGRYDLVKPRRLVIGIRPDQTHDKLPLYNKLAEQWDTNYEGLARTALAWDKNANQYAVVFPAGPAPSQRLYFQRIAQTGLPAGDSICLPLTVNCRKPTLACSGDNGYGLAWEDRSSKLGTIYFTHLSCEQGWVRASPPIRIGAGAEDPWRPSVSLAFSGKEYAVAWADQDQIRFMRISPAGQPVPDSQKTVAAGIDPHLVWLDGTYALVFANEGAVQMLRLDAAGNVQDSIQKFFPTPGCKTYTPRICWSGTQFGIAWEHVAANRRTELRFARADAKCKPIEGSLRTIADFASPPAISSHNGEFVITYRRGSDGYLMRMSDKGQVLEDRYLFWGATYLNHVTSNSTANVVYLHLDGRERGAELESCLFPLGK